MLTWAKENLADDSPLCKLFKKLDTVAEKSPDAFLGIYAVFLAKKDKKEKINLQAPLIFRMEELPKALDTKNIIYAVGNVDEPKSKVGEDFKPWFEKKDFETGVLIYDHYKVLDWQPFTAEKKLTDKDVDSIVKSFDSLVPDYARPGYRPKLKLPK